MPHHRLCVLLLAVSLPVLIAGCDGGGASDPLAAAPLIPDAFSYETTRPVDVDLRVRDAEGTPVPGVPLRLFTEDGETEVASGATGAAGRVRVHLSRPVREVALIAHSSYPGLPDSVRIPIRDGQARHTYGGPAAANTGSSPGAAPAPKASSALDLSFPRPFDDGVPLNQTAPSTMLNPEGNAALQQHSVLLNASQRDVVLLGVEDMRRDKGSDDDFNDARFYVTSPPITAIDRSALPGADLAPGAEVPPTRTYQPGKDQFATLAFEDLWPAAGDYDFNDMVVDYNVATQATPGGDVTGLTATFVTRAVGASFANGFGVSLPIEPRRIEQVSGTDLREGIVTTRPNGTEAGTDNAVIVVYDNVHNRTSRAGGFFNTNSATPYRPPDTIRVEVTFQPAVPTAHLGAAPYDPFIFVYGDRSRKVHLPDTAPTAHASADWFGKSQDASDASAGRFYKTRSNRPWALHLPASFRYPKEKASIRSAYRRFQPWAASGGRRFQDWYSSTAPGYRRSEQLYTRP